jgi:transposase
MARPTKRTRDRETRLFEALKAGNTRRASCSYAGISESSLALWMDRFPDFRDAVEKAEAEAEIRNVAIIQRAANETWQAAAWWLERRRSGDYRQRSEIQGNDGGPLRVVVEYAEAPCENYD